MTKSFFIPDAVSNGQIDMTRPQPHPTPLPPSPPFQFTLRTLLLLFVVLGSSLAVFREAAVVVYPVVLGLALLVNRFRAVAAHLVSILVGLVLLIWVLWLLPQIGAPREGGRRSACINKLYRIIGQALQDYHRANGCFPPLYLADTNGRPLHSWRTLLLPYLGYDDVYKSLDLTKPWDSPENAPVLAIHPREFFCGSDPSSRTPGTRQTNYLAVVGSNTAWSGDRPKKLSDFGKDASSTIMVIEVAGTGVDWAQPKDFSLDALMATGDNAPALPVFSRHGREEGFFFTDDRRTGVCALMANGDFEYLPTEALTPEKLRKILQIGGCKHEAISFLKDIPHDVTSRPNWPNIAALAVWLLSVGTLLTQAVRSRKVLPVPPPPAC